MRRFGLYICTFTVMLMVLMMAADFIPRSDDPGKETDPTMIASESDKETISESGTDSSKDATKDSTKETDPSDSSQSETETPSETVPQFIIVGTPEAPVLSHESGFYADAFSLTITAETGTRIYYTTDGSLPDTESTLYEGPITVYDRSSEPNLYRSIERVVKNWDCGVSEPYCVKTPVKKAFIIRAIAVSEDGKTSSVVNATYFINMSSYAGKQIISLIVDPDDFFGAENGIYVTGKAYDDWILSGRQGTEPSVNYEWRGEESEREASLELFNAGSLTVSQDVGIRIQGAGIRSYAPRRLSIYSRKDISGSAYFSGTLFGRELVHSFVTRDSALNNVCMALAEGRDVAVQNTADTPAVLFINGERWDTWYLQEKYSDNYFKTRYGISKKDLQYVKVTRWKEEERTALSDYGYIALTDYIKKNDMSNASNYEYVCSQLDIQSYIDFIALNVIFSNMDYWENKNYVVFRSTYTDGTGWNDGKWRFGLYDMDCLTYDTRVNTSYSFDYELDPFTTPGAFVSGSYNQLPLFASLRKNEDFCRQFVLSFMDILNTNLSNENVHAVIDTLLKDDGVTADSYKKGFFVKRQSYAMEQLKTNFGLSGSLAGVTVETNGSAMGTVTLNTISPDLSDGSWTGQYYTDYAVTLTATPVKGYRFVGWEGSITSHETTVSVPVTAGGITVRAVFEPEK